ncbi:MULTISPECIES: hypothetical protein [unclassified Streptomyces]|uniref:hypothetical protein n=1 Tax=unclassified Streptomyces TaxID=2593676 RepID=UPI003667554F
MKPSMTPRTAGRALPLLLAALLPLAGCGIPETGVVEAGEPATGVLDPGTAPSPSRAQPTPVPVAAVPLFFVEDGALASVTRAVPGATDPGTVVLMLFKGPDERERKRGLTTELPLAAAPTVRVDGASVTVLLPRGTGSLSDTAVDQLACTVAAARLRQDPVLDRAQVTVEQPGGRLAGRSSDDCPAGADPARTETGGTGTAVPSASGTGAPGDSGTGAPGPSGGTGGGG